MRGNANADDSDFIKQKKNVFLMLNMCKSIDACTTKMKPYSKFGKLKCGIL